MITRIDRKIGGKAPDVVSAQTILETASQEPKNVLVRKLRSRPAVARELAAELGDSDIPTLQLVFDTIGVEMQTYKQKQEFGKLLQMWDSQDEKRRGSLAERLGIKSAKKMDEKDWLKWLTNQSESSLSEQLSRTILSFEPNVEVRQEFGEYFQNNLETSLKMKH